MGVALEGEIEKINQTEKLPKKINFIIDNGESEMFFLWNRGR